ncbi:MAG: hypothetical protein ACHQQS_16010 [Thermoanaerobaculales bacterium]|jgi:hypothetical protein
MDVSAQEVEITPMSWPTGIEITCRYSWTRFLRIVGAALWGAALVWYASRPNGHHLWVAAGLVGAIFLLGVSWPVVMHELRAPKEVQLRDGRIIARWRGRELSLDPETTTVGPVREPWLKGVEYIEVRSGDVKFRVHANISNFEVLQHALREMVGQRAKEERRSSQA